MTLVGITQAHRRSNCYAYMLSCRNTMAANFFYNLPLCQNACKVDALTRNAMCVAADKIADYLFDRDPPTGTAAPARRRGPTSERGGGLAH